MTCRLALLGCGAMGESLLKGLLAAGWDPKHVVVAERIAKRAAAIRSTYDVDVASSIPGAAVGADVIVLAIKPQDVSEVVRGITRPNGERRLLISLCAGIRTAYVEQLAEGGATVRAMLNTAVAVRRGTITIAGGATATEADIALAEQILGLVGSVSRVPERDFDALTAICGSGPAYLYLLAEAMTESGIGCGLSRESAAFLTRQTLAGAATLLSATDDTPASLRHAVTSPGGATAAALKIFEAAHFRATVFDAVFAAAARSREISDAFDSGSVQAD